MCSIIAATASRGHSKASGRTRPLLGTLMPKYASSDWSVLYVRRGSTYAHTPDKDEVLARLRQGAGVLEARAASSISGAGSGNRVLEQAAPQEMVGPVCRANIVPLRSGSRIGNIADDDSISRRPCRQCWRYHGVVHGSVLTEAMRAVVVVVSAICRGGSSRRDFLLGKQAFKISSRPASKLVRDVMPGGLP